MQSPRIVVVGSLNADLVVRTARFPQPGETLTGSELAVIPGGKGANQAVAAGRLGGDVTMVGAVGDDAHGSLLLDSLSSSGVDVTRIAGVVPGDEAVVFGRQGARGITSAQFEAASGQIAAASYTVWGRVLPRVVGGAAPEGRGSLVA